MNALPEHPESIHPALWRASQLARAYGRTVDTSPCATADCGAAHDRGRARGNQSIARAVMARPLPEFAPLSLKELRSLWKKYRGNEDVERLVLEVQFRRGVINEIDGYFRSIHQAWRAENLGELVAIEKVRLLLIHQHVRQNVLAGLKPAPKRGQPPEPEPALVE